MLELEARNHRWRVTLIEPERVFELWIEYYPRLTELAKQRLIVTRVLPCAARIAAREQRQGSALGAKSW